MTKKMAIFCDFDGTITEKDNIIAIMKQFAPEGWEQVKDEILTEQMSIREGVGKLFSLLPSNQKQDITEFVRKQATIRSGFPEFVQYVQHNRIPLYIVSGGIDFFVEPILAEFGPFNGLYCNSANFDDETIDIRWPHSCDPECDNDCGCCKPSVIRSLKLDDDVYRIVIGDSVTDLQAARQADFVFARELLLEKASEYGLDHQAYETFFDIIDGLKQRLEVNE